MSEEGLLIVTQIYKSVFLRLFAMESAFRVGPYYKQHHLKIKIKLLHAKYEIVIYFPKMIVAKIF